MFLPPPRVLRLSNLQQLSEKKGQPQLKTCVEWQRIAGGERRAQVLLVSRAPSRLTKFLGSKERKSSRSWEAELWQQVPIHLLGSASTEEMFIRKKVLLSQK